MKITTHGNNMWGMVVWCGDVDGQAAILTATRLGAYLWVFKYQKGGWFKSDKSYWEKVKTFEDKAQAIEELKIVEL